MKPEELETIGYKVVKMLKEERFKEIASQYDYALKFNQQAEDAIKSHYKSALNECIGNIENSKPEVNVKNFEKNSTGLDTLIECDIPLEQSSGILVELILTDEDTIYLEQISSYRTEYNA